jgi:hypothetical protein
MSREIIDAIQIISGNKGSDNISYLPCSVVSVDEAARQCTCQALNGISMAPFSNVQLMAAVDDGVLYIPTVGSTVIVTYSKFNQPYVSFFSELDKILYVVGNSVVKIIDGAIQFNDGSFGGLTKIAALTQKLNNLENLVNDLISKYNSHTHILTLTSGTGTAAPTTTVEATTLTPTQRSDIENNLVTHGQ